MTQVHDFVVALAKGGKNFKEIKELVETVYGDKGLKMRAIYTILKKVKAGEDAADLRGWNTKKTVRTGDLIAVVAAAIEDTPEQTSGTLLWPTGQLMELSAASSTTV